MGRAVGPVRHGCQRSAAGLVPAPNSASTSVAVRNVGPPCGLTAVRSGSTAFPRQWLDPHSRIGRSPDQGEPVLVDRHAPGEALGPTAPDRDGGPIAGADVYVAMKSALCAVLGKPAASTERMDRRDRSGAVQRGAVGRGRRRQLRRHAGPAAAAGADLAGPAPARVRQGRRADRGRSGRAAIDFLTRTGQMCDDVRQEFILLSDVLGVSMLVETINHRTGGTSTESTVLGPFHMVESPAARAGRRHRARRQGHAVPGVRAGAPARTASRWPARRSTSGRPTTTASTTSSSPGSSPSGNLRGLFTADDDGRFWFRTVVPRYYPIPDDGPVGQLLARDRAAPLPAGAPALHRRRARLPAGDHARVRRRQPLPGLRRRVRGQGEPGPRRARGRRPGAGRGGRPAQPVPHADLRPDPAAGRSGPAGGAPADAQPTVVRGAPRKHVMTRSFTYQALPMRVRLRRRVAGRRCPTRSPTSG